MRNAWAAVVPTVLLAAASGAARAQSGDVTVAVLGIEATDVPESLAAELTDALRQRVAGTKGYQLVPGKDLVEIKLVFSCPDEAPGCMAQAAKSLGAAKLLYGGIKKSVSGDYVVSLKLLDAGKGVVDAWVADPLAQKQASGAAIRGPVQKWFATLIGQPATGSGTLRIFSNVTGATVAVDGNTVSTDAKEEVVVTDVPPGKHQIRIEKPGYQPAQQEVDLAAGGTQTVNMRLSEGGAAPPLVATPAGSAAPSPTAPDRPDDGKGALRAGFWITLGAGLASAGAAIKFGRDVVRVNQELDFYRRFPCSSSTGLCGKDSKQANPLSPADQKTVTDKRNEGTRAQTLQWVFVGVGGAFGIASAYLLYRGYLDGEPVPGERRASRGPTGLRIVPVAASDAGGILAEFDF